MDAAKTPTPSPDDRPRSALPSSAEDLQRVLAMKGHPPTGMTFRSRFDKYFSDSAIKSRPQRSLIRKPNAGDG